MQTTQILRIGDVMQAVGLSRVTIWRWVRDGKFPAPIRLGSRHIGWRSEEVQAWIDARPPVLPGD